MIQTSNTILKGTCNEKTQPSWLLAYTSWGESRQIKYSDFLTGPIRYLLSKGLIGFKSLVYSFIIPFIVLTP